MASLQALEDAVEAFCRAREQLQADEATGHSERADFGALERAHALVVSADTLAAVRAAADSAQTKEAQRPRLLSLRAFLARASRDAAARGANEALEHARRASAVSVAGAVFPLHRAWAAVAEEADRTRRAALALQAAAAEEALLGAHRRLWEVRQPAEVLDVRDAVTTASLEAEAVEFLRATEDGWRDVLGYATRRLEPGLRPLPQGEAALHDLLRLSRLPLPGAFPTAEALRPLREWLDASGLTLAAGGRVRLAEAAPGRLGEAACFPVEVPERVLLVTPGAGQGAFPQLLSAAGRARALAAVAPSASLSARRLGDEAVRESAGWLFRGALLSEAWLRRFLGHGRTVAREVARLSALAQLGELRMLAARLPLLPGLLAGGPSEAGLRGLAAAASEALSLRVPEGAFLEGLWHFPSEATRLRAAALADCLRQAADERFDAEDFRNPRAARWLASVWGRGAELDAEALAKDVSGGTLSLGRVGRRLLAVLGA